MSSSYYRRHLPKYQAVKEALPRLGELTEARIRLTQRQYFPGSTSPPAYDWRTDPEVAGGGLFMDLGSHQLDILDLLLGPIVSTSGMSCRMAPPPPPSPSSSATTAAVKPAEDNVRLMGTTATGVLVSGSWNFAAVEKVDEVEISGATGTLRFSCFDDAPPMLTVVGQEGGVHSEALECEPQPPHVHLPTVAELVKDLQRWKGDKAAWQGSMGGGAGPACQATGVAAARTNTVLDAALAGYYGTREGAFWEAAVGRV